jgi:hypothetical protein
MTGNCFLASYRPLIQTRQGREAQARHNLLPFVDGSCRREPDFECRFPSITATCRAEKLVSRLQVGDRVVYWTAKGKYLGFSQSARHLVAILRVIKKFQSHEEARTWYVGKRQPLPGNCLVEGNPPKHLDLTNGSPPIEVRRRVRAVDDPQNAVRFWDATYRQRVRKCSIFVVTIVEFLELRTPRQLSDANIRDIFGRIPGTLNPPKITWDQLQRLREFALRDDP